MGFWRKLLSRLGFESRNSIDPITAELQRLRREQSRKIEVARSVKGFLG